MVMMSMIAFGDLKPSQTIPIASFVLHFHLFVKWVNIDLNLVCRLIIVSSRWLTNRPWRGVATSR